MKKIILLFVMGFMMSIASAQVKYDYCEIVGTGNLTGTKVTVVVDYGQIKKLSNPNWIKDEEGNVQKFNSMIDAMNYMGEQGWEFVQAYAVTSGTSSHVYHFLLKREKQ